MDVNSSSSTSSALSNSGSGSGVFDHQEFLQQPTPAADSNPQNQGDEQEMGENLATTPSSRPSTPRSSDEEASLPPAVTSSSSYQQLTPTSTTSSSKQDITPNGSDASGGNRSNGSHNSGSTTSNPIISDHCYGLPYQDHNYGTSAASYPSVRNSGGNSNGSSNNGNNGGNYATSANQRHPSGSHRSNPSISTNGGITTSGVSPIQRHASDGSIGNGGNGGIPHVNRRPNFFPNGSIGKPPQLSHYGPTTPSNSQPDSRASPTVGNHSGDRSSFSDDDGSIVRSDACNIMMSTGYSASTAISTASSNSLVSPITTISASMIMQGLGSVAGNSTPQGGMGIIAIPRRRTIGPRQPGIHSRFIPPYTRLNVGQLPRMQTSSPLHYGVYGNAIRPSQPRGTTLQTMVPNFNVPLSPGLITKQPIHFPPHQSTPIKYSAPIATASNATPLQASPIISNGDQHQAPPKRPGRPRGARAVGQMKQQGANVATSTHLSSNEMVIPRNPRSKFISRAQQTRQTLSPHSGHPPGIYASGSQTPFNPSGLIGQPIPAPSRTTSAGSLVDRVESVMETVMAQASYSLPLTMLPIHQPTSYHHHPPVAYAPSVQEQIGGPPAVGTSPLIPAHPKGAIVNSGMTALQQQTVAAVCSAQEKFNMPSTSSNSNAASGLGIEEFKSKHNIMMSELCARVGLDKDDDAKPKTKFGNQHVVRAKREQRNAPYRVAEKSTGYRRQKKLAAIPAPVDVENENKPEDKHAIETTGNSTVDGEKDTVSAEKDTSSSEDEWAGKDYTTRCLCEMDHNDEFMIQCDRCEVWQHCECMGMDTKNIPESYLCEQCEPRPLKLTREEAQRLQQTKVLQFKRKKAAAAAAARRRRQQMTHGKRSSLSSGSSTVAGGRGRPKKSTTEAISGNRKRQISSGDTDTHKRSKASISLASVDDAFTEVAKNTCTAKVARAVRASGDTVGAAILLSQLPAEPPCKSMFVAAGRQGLVSTDNIQPDLPIIEYRGKVCWYTDFLFPNGKGVRAPAVAPYLLYYRNGDVDGSELLNICVDARFTGTSARFVRRSCQPNSQVRHVVYNGTIHLILVSTELIEESAEITIPFDYDISKCNFALECACSNSPLRSPNADCPIQIHNRSLTTAVAGSSGNDGEGVITQQSNSHGNVQEVPVKRRPGRPPGSGKARQTATSAATAAARKKSKNARGFKSRTTDNAPTNQQLGLNRIRRGNVKREFLKVALGRRESPSKKCKPTSTADLTKRRFSDDTAEDANSAIGSPVAVTTHGKSPMSSPIQKSSTPKGGRPKAMVNSAPVLSTSPLDQHQAQHLSREERKIQSLMEQIQRMEEREQRKAEKKMAKLRHSSDIDLEPAKMKKKLKSGRVIGRRKSVVAGTSSVPASRRKRTESEAVNVINSMNRPRLWSQNGETSNDASYDDAPGPSKKFRQQSPRRIEDLSDLIRASSALSDESEQSLLSPGAIAKSTSPSFVQQKASASDVAKKRWLRQAMSEEKTLGVNATSTAALNTTMHIDTKQPEETIHPMQISPPSAVAPPKKRIIQEFNATSNERATASVTHESSVTSDSYQDVANISEGPISTVEAAQLLAELHHQPLVPPQNVIQAENTVEWTSPIQQQPTAPLKMIHPEERPMHVPSPEEFLHKPTPDGRLPSISTNQLFFLPATTTTTTLDDATSFTTSPSFTTSIISRGDQESILPSNFSKMNPMSGYLYSAIEDNIPLTQGAAAVDGGLPMQQVQKKKMSLDEYKKRKRESVNEPQQPSTPNADQTEGSSPTPPVSNTVPTTSNSSPMVQRQQSFIPQVKESVSDVKMRSLRLSSIPDPDTIGKSSTTLDDLRKRIYTRTFSGRASGSTDSEQQPSSMDMESRSISHVMPPIGRDPRSGANAGAPRSEANTQQESHEIPDDEANALDVDDTATHRLSLVERLRVEFGLD